MTTKHSHIYATSIGPVLIEDSDGGISRIAFGAPHPPAESPSELTNACAGQLLEYLAGKRRVFDIKLALKGSPFQRSVWEAVQAIPYGQVRSCTDLGLVLGCPGSRRQIGRAAAQCPCAPVVPIHRIGSLDDPLSQRLRELEAAG